MAVVDKNSSPRTFDFQKNFDGNICFCFLRYGNITYLQNHYVAPTAETSTTTHLNLAAIFEFPSLQDNNKIGRTKFE